MSLISTYDLRTWMGIEEGDRKPNAKLDELSKAIESFVESFTNRKLSSMRYNTDPSYSYLDGNGKSYIYLPLYPISYISSIHIDIDRDFGSATLLDPDDYFFYPSGKVVSEAGHFSRGRRNIKIDYVAGFSPVTGGTYDSTVGSYPIPSDLKQTMVEMCVESFKEGMTAVHTVESRSGEPKFIQMLTKNSFWSNVLNKYKAFDVHLGGGWE